MDIEAIANRIHIPAPIVTEGYVNDLTLDFECDCGQRQFFEVWEAGTVATRYTLAAVMPEDIRCGNCQAVVYPEGEEVIFDEADYEALSERY